MEKSVYSGNGFFGNYGGRFVPEVLEEKLVELEQAFEKYHNDSAFITELEALQRDFIGRENPLTYAKNLSNQLGGAKIYLKREDLNHTGAHKINNCIGQALLAKRMGKKESLQKQVQDNMALQRQRFVHYLAWIAPFTWVRKIWKGSSLMFLGCGY